MPESHVPDAHDWTLAGEVPEGAESPALELDLAVRGVTALLAPPSAALGRIAGALGLPGVAASQGSPGRSAGGRAERRAGARRRDRSAPGRLASSLPADRVGLLAPPLSAQARAGGASFASRATLFRQAPTPLTALRDLAKARSLASPRDEAARALERHGLGDLASRPLGDLGPVDARGLAVAAALLGGPGAVIVDARAPWPGGPAAGSLVDALRSAGFTGPVLLLADRLGDAGAADRMVVLDRASNDLGTVTRLVTAQSGAPDDLAHEPRTPFLAGELGLTLFSGLARGGKLSIGHTPITAPTDLDGQVLITLPAAAVAVRHDDSDPDLPRPSRDKNVYRAYVVGRRTRGGEEQVELSPTNPDLGLAVWGVPSERVAVGAKVLATVDPGRLLARPFERDGGGA